MLTVTSQMFCLTSPTAIGQQANSILNDVLNGFVEEERAAAERDDVSVAAYYLTSTTR